jgi:hypothetical protein
MAGQQFDKNDKPRLKAQFVSQTGVLNDPSEVTFKHKDPSGNTATLTYVAAAQVIRESTGIYYFDLALDEVGTWYFRAEGTGTPQVAAEMAFEVRTTQF